MSIPPVKAKETDAGDSHRHSARRQQTRNTLCLRSYPIPGQGQVTTQLETTREQKDTLGSRGNETTASSIPLRGRARRPE